MSSPHWLNWAPELQTFWPLTTHSSPSRTARHDSPARSEPAPGSLNNWQERISAASSGFTNRAFSSSLPSARSVEAISPTVTLINSWLPGDSYSRSRCPSARACARLRPSPPYSSGQDTAWYPRVALVWIHFAMPQDVIALVLERHVAEDRDVELAFAPSAFGFARGSAHGVLVEPHSRLRHEVLDGDGGIDETFLGVGHGVPFRGNSVSEVQPTTISSSSPSSHASRSRRLLILPIVVRCRSRTTWYSRGHL